MNDSSEFEPEFELTAHELNTIVRFVIGINTPAFQAAIFGRVRTGHDYSKDQRRLVSKALKEINVVCGFEMDDGGVGYVSNPAGIVSVTPSLVLVLSYALPKAGLARYELPADFIPGRELVQRCLNRYHELVRQEAAGVAENDD